MPKPKLIRITTVPISLEKLLEGQLSYMEHYFDVTAVSANAASLQKLAASQGIKAFPLEMTRKITPLQDLKAVYKLYRFLKKEQPHIVHSHTPKAGIVGMLAARLARVPVRLHTVAGLPLMEAKGIKRSILNAVEKLTYACTTKVYPNSKGLYHFIVEQQFTSPNKLAIIGNGSSNGIDTQYFDPQLFSETLKIETKQQLDIPEDAFVFVFVGRLVSDKGINELITAFTQLYQEYTTLNTHTKPPYLLLVGPLETALDPLLPATLTAIEQHKHIITTGYQQDVRPYFAIANALTFPSYREGFPNVVLQAGAMGLPAIVSNINGCNEIIRHDVNGYIVPVKTVAPLLAAMRSLLNDSAITKKLGATARQSIVTTYKREEIWDALLKEYHTLLQAT